MFDSFKPTESLTLDDGNLVFDSTGGGGRSTVLLPHIEQHGGETTDGGIVIKFDELRAGGWQPFAAAGGGYLRQLHEGLTLTEEGHLFYVGGGARRTMFTRPSGLLRALGARIDVRLNILSGGITVENNARNHLSASASLFVSF